MNYQKPRRQLYSVHLDPAIIEWLKKEAMETSDTVANLIRDSLRQTKKAADARSNSEQAA
jgi:ribosomal protein S16